MLRRADTEKRRLARLAAAGPDGAAAPAAPLSESALLARWAPLDSSSPSVIASVAASTRSGGSTATAKSSRSNRRGK